VNLNELNLSKNRIEMVSGLAAVPILNKLVLSDNRITSVDKIRGLKDCKNLQDVTLSGNPLTNYESFLN